MSGEVLGSAVIYGKVTNSHVDMLCQSRLLSGIQLTTCPRVKLLPSLKNIQTVLFSLRINGQTDASRNMGLFRKYGCTDLLFQ